MLKMPRMGGSLSKLSIIIYIYFKHIIICISFTFAPSQQLTGCSLATSTLRCSDCFLVDNCRSSPTMALSLPVTSTSTGVGLMRPSTASFLLGQSPQKGLQHFLQWLEF